MSPKLSEPIRQLRQLFMGENIVMSDYDPAAKSLIVIISGDQAENYESLVRAAQAVARTAADGVTQMIAKAHQGGEEKQP